MKSSYVIMINTKYMCLVAFQYENTIMQCFNNIEIKLLLVSSDKSISTSIDTAYQKHKSYPYQMTTLINMIHLRVCMNIFSHLYIVLIVFISNYLYVMAFGKFHFVVQS